jgi:DNA-binding winged helix-turn-helix (wHTH) protein
MQLRFEDCVLDSGTRELHRGGAAVALSPLAFRLLELLVQQRPNALSKEELNRSLWPNTYVADGNLANLVNELRTALNDDARHSRIIRTIQRYGYAFQASGESVPGPGAPATASAAYRLIWGDREIALVAGENLIGRDQKAVVWVDDASVSRHHARILIDDSGARLEDLGSKNGTYRGGLKVERAVSLNDGDALRLGSVAMVFRRLEAGASTATASKH